MSSRAEPSDVDVLVVGAGFAGLYLVHRARTLGLSVLAVEAAEGVGGTWHWNRYPGARCDVESIDYSYSFSSELEQEWVWTERFASQPEILAYLEHVADRFDLRRDIRLGTRVTSARYDEDERGDGCWTVGTDAGDVLRASFVVLASGSLSAPKRPDFPGLDDFTGRWFHTARWPADGVDVAGRRVVQIGTGSTGIQAAPMLAADAEHLVVMQRTPNYSVPARNRALATAELDAVKAGYGERRARGRRTPSGVPPEHVPGPGRDLPEAQRRADCEIGWAMGGAPALLRLYSDVMSDTEVNESVGRFVRDKIAEIVDDPATADVLTARGYPFGAKRLCVDTGYFATFNRDNVELVDVRADPIERITATGVATASGAEYPADVIVFAIGFDAISGPATEIDIRGRHDRSLREYWSTGPKATLGLTVAGFPNLFLVNGPGSPAVLGNVVAFAEQHVEWITDCIAELRARGVARIETTDDADELWAAHVDDVGSRTLYTKAPSWYSGANVPGKPQRFLPYAGGLDRYRDRCDDVAARGYEDFVLAAGHHTAGVDRPGGSSPADLIGPVH